ncbi:MAG TPA: hypothetical protein VGB92_20250 [Longimicrobium sp.]|jgi:hypothetical protein
MAALEEEILARLAKLSPIRRQALLDYARELNGEPRHADTKSPVVADGTARAFRDAIAAGCLPSDGKPEGVPGEALKPFFGIWTPEEGAEMWKAIEEECRCVDPDGW